MNKKTFSYRSNWSCLFECECCDFSEPIVVRFMTDQLAFARDLAEMIGYHATNIRPNLNGFQGYDTLNFEFN